MVKPQTQALSEWRKPSRWVNGDVCLYAELTLTLNRVSSRPEALHCSLVMFYSPKTHLSLLTSQASFSSPLLPSGVEPGEEMAV